MKIARRSFLNVTVTGGAAASLSSCNSVTSRITEYLGQTIPERIGVAGAEEIDQTFHLLSRAAYGPWPGDLERVRALGVDSWIEEQLHPEKIDDRLCDFRARRFETLQHDPGTCYEYKKTVLREEIARHTLLRAVYSRRQLFEVMAGFWTDHFNINIEKGDAIYLKPADDREVIRAHALGSFKDLVRASAISPAMLVYLDGKENKREKPTDLPNENYARELLELHTLGVHGGYTQKDVYETARCLTGWRLRDSWRKGTVYFDHKLHDDGEKVVLGHHLPAGNGESDLDRVVEIVCQHPSTARHIAEKLVQRFVAEDAPSALIDRVATTFTRTSGDIKSLLRTVLTSDEFRRSRGMKFKQPFRYIVNCLRFLGADTHVESPLLEYLTRMGQGLFQHPAPDGYPDKTSPWLGTLLWRWNFAFALVSDHIPSTRISLDRLANAIEGSKLDPAQLFPHFVGRRGTMPEIESLTDFVAGQKNIGVDYTTELFGLILASPAFQRY